MRADAGDKELPSDKVASLIGDLYDLSAKAFTADDAPAQAKYGLNKPVADVKVTCYEGKRVRSADGGFAVLGGGDVRVERVLMAAGPEGKYYAARENEPATYEIEKSAYENFQKAVSGLK